MREFLERIGGGGAAEEIFEATDQINEAAAHVKEQIKKIEGGLSKLADFEKWLDDNAETADELAKLEARLAQAKEEIKWLNEEIEEKQNILDTVKDRGVAHEYGCKFYMGATCQCLPPEVAEWLAT